MMFQKNFPCRVLSKDVCVKSSLKSNMCNRLEAVFPMVFPFTEDISRIMSDANNDR